MQPEGLALEVALPAERIVSRVRAGDSEAFRELFETYRGLVYRLATRLLSDPEEAADLTQEVFLVVHRRIHTLRDCRSLRAWICRITVTRARNRLRLLRRRKASAHLSLEDPAAQAQPLSLRSPRPDPERALLGKESLQAVLRALSRLPFAYRAAVVMRDIEDLTYEEIAASLHISQGTVKSRIARGRDALRRTLAEEET